MIHLLQNFSRVIFLGFIATYILNLQARTQSPIPPLKKPDHERLFIEQLNIQLKKDFSLDFQWDTREKESFQGDKKERKKGNNQQTKVTTKPPQTVGEAKVAALLEERRKWLAKNKKDKVLAKKSSSSWMNEKKGQQTRWVENTQKLEKKWIQKKKEILDLWHREKLKLKKNLPALKEDLTNLSDFQKETISVTEAQSDASQSISENKTKELDSLKLDYNILSPSFRLPIRSQGKRSTCSAFAAVRAMEILAYPQVGEKDLSEQFFYYASKPKCQKSPCSKKGSWPLNGFRFRIPSEDHCPYTQMDKQNNETHIPLAPSCKLGQAKVQSFSKLKSRQEIQTAIREGKPVIGGFRLNDAFFENEGYVFLNGEPDEFRILSPSRHAAGHALVLVGVMDLPQKLWAKQGKHCTVVANSWGEGWGLGGHACVSDGWFDQYRYQFPFLSVDRVSFE
ncbi:MAG: hypothetical protein CME60_07075 [Halobacteriovoraceae bacterium]|nr:hypothetical protein [Halobacteriovoraceae bacterium]